MKKIKVCYIHPDVKDLESMKGYLPLENFSIEDFVWDDVDPDYFFATEYVYFNHVYFEKFKRLSKTNAIRIFVSGEAIAPDLNIFDYAIVFNKKLSNMDRIASTPAFVYYAGFLREERENHMTETEARAKLKNGLRFCNFIYSNGKAHPNRDNLFYALSNYKRVDSLGWHLNNVNALIDVPSGENWSEVSIKTKSKYKFTIASENAQYEGYTSEKLLTSFQAHSLPIYWGNKFVSEEFNSEAFIDCSQYDDDFERVVKRVQEIDNDDDLWIYMITREWQTDEQKKASHEEYMRYREFITNIFSQTHRGAVRRPLGFWPDNYYNWIMERQEYPPRLGYGRRIIRALTDPEVISDKLKRLRMRKIDIDEFFKD